MPGAPTVLVYGHYDVQPPDPLDEWISPPFEPTVRDGNLYARGATDDKGQMLTHVKSAEAWIETAGRLPLQLKYLIEGEEEVGSDEPGAFIAREPAAAGLRLASVISDTCQFAPGAAGDHLRPAGNRLLRTAAERAEAGSALGHVRRRGGQSGQRLCTMLAALIDDQGHVQVPGFYDDVEPLDAARAKRIRRSCRSTKRRSCEQIGVDALRGEEGYTTLERRWARPTFDINGLWSGYQGEGAKTVLPARAGGQVQLSPGAQAGSAKDLRRAGKPTARAVSAGHPDGADRFSRRRGVVVPLDSPYMAAAERAIEAGLWPRAGVHSRRGIDSRRGRPFTKCWESIRCCLGWGLDDDNTHSPNEKFCLADFHRGIKASAYLWQTLGGTSPRTRSASRAR